MKLLSRFIDSNDRELRRIQPMVDEANALEPEYEALSDDDIRAAFAEIRDEIREVAAGEEPSDRAVHRWEAEGGDAAGLAVATAAPTAARVRLEPGTPDGEPVEFELKHGSVVIAAITSCTNTSNPSVMIGAALLARNAAARGLRTHAADGHRPVRLP